MLKRLVKTEGPFEKLDKLTNTMYNLEKSIDGFHVDIHSIQQLPTGNGIYEMIYSIPCKTYYRGFNELEKPNLCIKNNELLTITHKFKDSNCHIDINIDGNIKLYSKSGNNYSSGLSVTFKIDWNSKGFEHHKKIESELFNFSGYIFDTMTISTTLCHVSNYATSDENSKNKLLKEYWNLEFK